MKHPFQRAPAWFALASMIMIGVAALVYSAVRQTDEVDGWVNHTHWVIDRLSAIAAGANAAERGAHAYVLTGDKRFLDPYHQGAESATAKVNELEAIVKDNAPQAERARALRRTLREQIDGLADQVALRRTESFEQARALVLKQPGMSETGGVGPLVIEMKMQEERLLGERSEQSFQSRRAAIGLGAAGLLLNLIITGLVLEMLRRENRQRMSMQAELIETNEKVSESLKSAAMTAARLAKTIENIPLGIVLMDAELKVLTFNDRFLELLGATRGDIEPGDELEKIWLFGMDRNQISHEHLLNLADRRRDLIENPKPYRFERIHANGRLLEARGTPIPGGGFVKIYTDITRQRAESAKLLEQRNSAEEIARAKSEFLAVMSHEVRTPMNGVMGIAEMLRDTTLTPEQENYVNIILRSGESLLTILNDILDLSKVEAGKVELESTPFEPKHLLEDMLALWAPRASEKGLTMKLSMNSELPHNLMGDAGRLRQVISNLIGNAVKFTEHGGVTIDARIMTQDRDSAMLSFSVIDTGIGISEEQRHRLFQPFAQADASTTRRFGGTGLGLAISLRLVELLGGALDVYSQEDHGSVFSFTARFPFAKEGDIKEVSAPRVDAEQTTFSGTVLVVEDHAVNRAVARASLTRLGLTVVEAMNGREGVDAVRERHIDMVFMDMHMPVMDGLDATREIRAAEAAGRLHGHLPIVAMTANVLPQAIGACVEAGMDGFLCKPFARSQLLEALEHWLPEAPRALPARAGAEAQPAKAVLEAQPAVEAPRALQAPSPDADSAVPAFEALAAALEVIDAKRYALLEETMGDEMHELLDNFRSTSHQLIPSLQEACASGDWDRAFRDAHTLGSGAAMIGASSLATLARRLENLSRAGGDGPMTELAAQLNGEYARVEEALAAMLPIDGIA